MDWQSLLVMLDTILDQNADQLWCGCFWLWAKCETADVLLVLVSRNIIAVVTRCSDKGCHLKFGAVVKLFNYLNVEALVNIRSL